MSRPAVLFPGDPFPASRQVPRGRLPGRAAGIEGPGGIGKALAAGQVAGAIDRLRTGQPLDHRVNRAAIAGPYHPGEHAP